MLLFAQLEVFIPIYSYWDLNVMIIMPVI